MSLGLPAIVAGIVPHGTAEEIAVFGRGTDQRMILGERRCRLWRRSNLLDRLFEQPLDGRTHVLVAVDAVVDGVRAGLLDCMHRRSNASARARPIGLTSSAGKSPSPPRSATPTAGQFVTHIKALPGNPYDGHTLETVIPDMEAMVGNTIARILADKGYRGHPSISSGSFSRGRSEA